MNVAIVGTREPKISYEKFKTLVSAHVSQGDIIVSGGAKGIDSYARRYAEESNLELHEYKPDYKKYGRGAPLVRNTTIVDDCDVLLAFPSEKSRGTYDTIRKANKLNKPVYPIKDL